MNPFITPKTAAIALLIAFSPVAHAQFTLTGTSYTQNFNSLSSGLPSNWTVRTGATATAQGTTASLVTSATNWTDTIGDFKNLASATGLLSSSTPTAQQNSTNRALGIRQGGSFGDPGASFNFNFNSTGLTLSNLSLDLQMLSVQTRSTTWSVQYAIGASPTSWTTFATYSDPGTFGSTTVTATSGALSAMSNQSNVWFRVVSLSASSGSGTRDTFAIDDFSMSFSGGSAIPEPSTYAAMIGAVVLAGAVMRRQRSRSSL